MVSYVDWMSRLPDAKKDTKLNELCIPATHDSGAYCLDWSHPIQNSWKYRLAGAIPFVRNIIHSWAVTEWGDISTQLRTGIRCIDLRVSYDEPTNLFYIAHTFACVPFYKTINDIRQFVRQHPGEVVILQMKPEWANRNGFYPQMDKFRAFLASHLSDIVYTPTQKLPTINEMTTQKRNVLAIWGDSNTTLDNRYYWDCNTIQGNWVNSSDLDTNMVALERLLDNPPTNVDYFFNFSIAMTPQVHDVVISVFQRIFVPCITPRSLTTLAREIQQACQTFFLHERRKLSRMNIICTDMPYRGFVEQVVELNY